MTLSEKLASMNIALPPAPAAAGAYVPAKKVGDLIFVSGQIPMKDGTMMAKGRCPQDARPTQRRRRRNSACSTHWRL